MTKIISFLFALYILLLPWQSVFLLREVFIDGQKWHYGTIGLYPATIIALILMIFLIIGRFFHKVHFAHIDRLTLLIGSFFIGFSLLSSFWSHNHSIALYLTLLFFIGFLLYVILPHNTISLKTATLLLLVSASLHSIIALVQFLTQSIDPHILLNISTHFSESGTTATITNTMGRWLRAYGGMTHPNILGGFLALSILLGLQTYAQVQKSHTIMRVSLLIGLSCAFIGIIVTFSRSAWIALFFGLLTATILLWRKKQFLFTKIQMPLLAFMSIGLLFLLFLPQLFYTRSIEQTHTTHNSFTDRAFSSEQAKKLVRSAPLLGIGRGNMTILSYEESNDHQKEIWQHQPVHNVFLLVFAELGIIGFFSFIALLSIIVHTLWRASKTHPVAHVFFASICTAFLVIAFFDHWLITSHFGILFFWLLMTLYHKTPHH